MLSADRATAASDLRLEAGDRGDYRALARFHYKAGEPATMTQVLTLRQRIATVIGRYLSRGAEDVLAAVLVISLPHPGCMMRDIATNRRYRDLTPRQSMQLLNKEVRTISRVVVDPQNRGLGLAVRLVREAMRLTDEPYLEALAAMGRVHPFFEQAGMRRYDRPPLAAHQRLLDALCAVGLQPWELASPALLRKRLGVSARPGPLLMRELRRFARSASHLPADSIRQADPATLLAIARDHLLCQPVYYLYRTTGGGLTTENTESTEEDRKENTSDKKSRVCAAEQSAAPSPSPCPP